MRNIVIIQFQRKFKRTFLRTINDFLILFFYISCNCDLSIELFVLASKYDMLLRGRPWLVTKYNVVPKTYINRAQ